ncbi:MAG: DUF3592 domain-containing protein [Rhodothermales bacterium]|nr:DUF3592 domain-containing protein [Rhodothermales bacterium]
MNEYIVAMWNLAVDGGKQGILFFVAVYAFLLPGYSLIRQLIVRRWPGTPGVLIRAGVEGAGGVASVKWRGNYIATALYSYQVDGKSYDGSRVSAWVMMASYNARFLLQRQLDKIQTSGDGRVMVYYNPKNPQKSFLLKPGYAGLAVTVTLMLVPGCLYVMHYHP